MLHDADFASWCRKLSLSSETVALIESIRRSQPTRAVHSSRGNVTGRYPSRKMGVTIQFESHKNELAFIHEYEHEKDVLEFYDQPSTIKLSYEATNGRRLGVLHTPDIFVIRTEEAGWEECKTEEKLIKLASKNPNRYFRDLNGSWRCPPGEAYAEPFGLYYHVRSSKEINWIYQRNIEFLDDFFRSDSIIVAMNARTSLLEATTTEHGITLEELIRGTKGITCDDIYILIARGELYVDLGEAPLTEPNNVRIFPNKEAATAYKNLIQTSTQTRCNYLSFLDIALGSLLQWDGRGWTVINVGETTIGLIGDGESFVEVPLTAFEKLIQEGRITGLPVNAQSSIHPEAKRRIEQADTPAYAEANRLHEIVRAYINGESLPINTTISERTLRRLKAKYLKAEEVYGSGYIGLLPLQRKGNTKSA